MLGQPRTAAAVIVALFCGAQLMFAVRQAEEARALQAGQASRTPPSKQHVAGVQSSHLLSPPYEQQVVGAAQSLASHEGRRRKEVGST